MMHRRHFLGGLAAAAATRPFATLAQAKRPLVALLTVASQATAARYIEGFPLGMRELGYVEGRDLDIVWRFADGDLARLPALAEELARLNPTVIVASNTPGALAVQAATRTIPVVMVAATDPVGFGLVASYARPGGNVTGLLNYVDTLPGKLLEIATEAVPGATRIGLLMNEGNPTNATYREGAEAAARKLGVTLVPVVVRSRDDLEGAFQTLVRERAGVVLVLPDPMLLDQRKHVAALASMARLPAVYPYREHVEDGGLMSFGINVRESYRGVAPYVDRILKGARPADLPMALPTRFELVINLKTAKAIGVAIPPTLLALADEVIE